MQRKRKPRQGATKKLHISECFMLYLHNCRSVKLQAIESCVWSIRCIERKMGSILRQCMSVNSTLTVSQKIWKNFLSILLSLVSLTPLINLYFRISPRIFITIRNSLYFILRGPKKLIHEKNLKSKSRVRVPLQIVMAVGRAHLIFEACQSAITIFSVLLYLTRTFAACANVYKKRQRPMCREGFIFLPCNN